VQEQLLGLAELPIAALIQGISFDASHASAGDASEMFNSFFQLLSALSEANTWRDLRCSQQVTLELVNPSDIAQEVLRKRASHTAEFPSFCTEPAAVLTHGYYDSGVVKATIKSYRKED
jgi:hypothetical protein